MFVLQSFSFVTAKPLSQTEIRNQGGVCGLVLAAMTLLASSPPHSKERRYGHENDDDDVYNYSCCFYDVWLLDYYDDDHDYSDSMLLCLPYSI